MPTSFKDSALQTLKVLLIHLGIFFTFFLAIYYVIHGSFSIIPKQFIQWDTGWYLSIVEGGYVFIENQQNNNGFFPLFPLFWYITSMGPIGISLVNLVLFIVSFILLVFYFKPKEKTQYLFLSLPSFLFFLVPYSESLFFIFSSLIIIGLKKENWILTLVAFFFATLTRSAATIFLPALIATCFFVSNTTNLKKTITDYSLYILTCIVSTAMVIYIQYLHTDVWFAATHAQKQWGHYLQIPHFPLKSWGNSEIVRLDGTGMLIGLTSLYFLLMFFISKIKTKNTAFENYTVFSLLYLGGITMSILLFQGGDLHSLNRYIFCTPFYFVFLLEFEKRNFTFRQILIGFLILNVFWLSCGSYLHIIKFLDFMLMSAFLSIALLIYNSSSEKIKKWSFLFIYLVCTFWQAYFLARHLNKVWIG